MDLFADHPYWLALAIFLARVLDVSLGTVRTILVIRGRSYFAAAMGFVETLVWILAVSQVIQNLDSWYLAIAYAAGFATGNVAGIWLEERLAIGSELVRVISEKRDVSLARHLRERDFHVLAVEGSGAGEEPVEVLFVVESRRRTPALLRAVREVDPHAICTATDVRRHVPSSPAPLRRRLRAGLRPGSFQ